MGAFVANFQFNVPVYGSTEYVQLSLDAIMIEPSSEIAGEE